MNYITRELETVFLEASGTFKAVMVTGARQVGKSTMLKHLAEKTNRTIVTMDRQANRELANNDPELFFQTFKPPILIDEVQKAPALFEQIKIICDSSEEKGLFWLTGSESRKLLDKANDTLAGRIAILKMYPYSEMEKNGTISAASTDFSFDGLKKTQLHIKPNDIEDTFKSIWKGSLPDAQNLSEKMLATYFDSYIENYLVRDAVDDNGIKDTEAFRKFLRACAAFTGQVLNYSDLANSAGIAVSTAKEWIKILQGMRIVYLLEPYSNNELRRLIKTPKLYFFDTGLCAYLSRWKTRDVLMEGASSGQFYETFVVNELIKRMEYTSDRSEITYYRDHNSKEIDVIIEDSMGIHALEIKKSAKPNANEIKKFSLLEKANQPISYGGIVCMCAEPLPIDRLNSFIPSNLI